MKTLTRRHLLRGAGVALALPWLESLEPKAARGQTVPPRVRFVPIFFPLGTASFWKPKAPGVGAAWQLSPILEPLTPVKSQVTVLAHVDQTAYGPMGVSPSNGPLTGSFLTGAKCSLSSAPGGNGQNGVSIDQRFAQTLVGATPLPSLQLGLSTQNSYCDGTPCAYSRSISWKDATTPLFKLVDPQAIFDAIVAGDAPIDPAAKGRRAARKSVLDFVIGNASKLSPRLGHSDRARMDQFLTSVRELELRVAAPSLTTPQCAPLTRPTWSASTTSVPADYSRDTHANLVVDLIVMALSCDVTRVVSLMLDDARSDFPYDFLDMRTFTATGSTPGPAGQKCTNLVGYANTTPTNPGWATVDWWYVSKLARLCEKLASIPDGGGASMLDNSLVWFGSGQWEEWRPTDLPTLYVGSGGGRLKVDRYIDFAPSQSLSNVYLTFLRSAFLQTDAAFGDSTGVIPDIVV